jgi:sulfofructose kinase
LVGFRRVVGLGLCVVDELVVVDDLGLAAPRTRYRERLRSAGGMMSTALAQAAQLGCETHLLSMVGADTDGRFIARELRSRGVVTRRLLRSDAQQTTLALVLVDRRSGERRFIVPDRRALEASAPDFDLSLISRDTLLLVDGHFPDQAQRAVERARAKGARVVADFSAPRPACLRLLPFVDFPILPEEFGVAWGMGDARETLRVLQARYGGTPAITQGRRGALVLYEGRVRRVPAPRVRVRDTTGAGDVFHGAFAAGLALGRDVPGALELAARAAALSCTALGGFGRLMTREEMDAPWRNPRGS